MHEGSDGALCSLSLSLVLLGQRQRDSTSFLLSCCQGRLFADNHMLLNAEGESKYCMSNNLTLWKEAKYSPEETRDALNNLGKQLNN